MLNSKIPEIDVHGLTRVKAREYIYEEILKFQKKGIYCYKIVHGFNNGNAIKTWIRGSLNIYDYLNVYKISDDPLNPGATYIFCKRKLG